MTTYRLWPSTNGPSSAVSYSGNFISGLGFTLDTGSWLAGYWWWVCGTGQSTSPVKCALWSVTSTSGAGTVVPGSVVTSGTLTAGQWNYIPLSTPVQLSQGHDTNNTANGSIYIAAVGCNGAFPDTNNYFASGNPGGNGIQSGPLFAYSAASAGAGAFPPWNMGGGGLFSTAGTDPSTTIPLSISNSGDTFWVDVQVSDTPPSGYSGSYRLWPNKWDSNPYGTNDDAVAYNVATEIDITGTVTLDYIWYWVPPSISATAGLATEAGVWDTSSQTLVASITSPSWTLADGSATPSLGSNAAFWCKAAFSGSPSLGTGKYRVSVYNANGASGVWGPKDAQTGYFTVGAAKNGITWGPLTAPDQAAAQSGDFYPGTGTGTTGAQPVFAYDGTFSYPHFTTGTNPAQCYFTDLEVTPSGSSAVSGADSAAGHEPAAGSLKLGVGKPITARAWVS